jgi:hypothetical protein
MALRRVHDRGPLRASSTPVNDHARRHATAETRPAALRVRTALCRCQRIRSSLASLVVRRRLTIWILLLLWWTGVALVYTEQSISMATQNGTTLGWAQVLPVHLAGTWLWVPLSVGLFALVRRFPIERPNAWRAIAVLSAGVLLVIVIRATFVLAANPLTHWWYAAQPALLQVFIDSARNNVVLAWLVIGVAHAEHYFRREQRSRTEIAELRAEVTQSRLDRLAAQLHPHFLFNALNSIAEMLHHDPERADRMLIGLSALLRQSLNRSGEQEITLRDELALLTHYVEIEKVRLGNRLTFQAHVGPECMDCNVPVLLLQPLVENSIIHNIAKRDEPGKIEMRIERIATESLRVQIDDDGPAPMFDRSRAGIGLSNTESRLRALYGDLGTIDVSNNDRGGARVRIRLPFRSQPVSEHVTHADAHQTA